MKMLIACKRIDDEELHFILVNESYSEQDEPFTLFVHANHYSAERVERDREFFHDLAEAFDHCKQVYGISQDEWVDEVKFTKDFQFQYKVTDLGVPQPYVLGFEGGKVVFKFEQSQIDGNLVKALNISGNREGLRQLAAWLLLCADGEIYDDFFHVHLEDAGRGVLSDIPVTLRNPSYFAYLIQAGLQEEDG